jgi:hypothetical protein
MQSQVLMGHARSIRDLTILIAARFRRDDAYRVPPSCRNCAIWNVGHLLIVQEKCVLHAFGEEGILPTCYHALFAAGTSPCSWNGNRPEWDEVVGYLDPARSRVEEFLSSGVDLGKPLPEPEITPDGVLLTDLGDSLSFCTMHEAIHLGVLMTYSRLLCSSST